MPIFFLCSSYKYFKVYSHIAMPCAEDQNDRQMVKHTTDKRDFVRFELKLDISAISNNAIIPCSHLYKGTHRALK